MSGKTSRKIRQHVARHIHPAQRHQAIKDLKALVKRGYVKFND